MIEDFERTDAPTCELNECYGSDEACGVATTNTVGLCPELFCTASPGGVARLCPSVRGEQEGHSVEIAAELSDRSFVGYSVRLAPRKSAWTEDAAPYRLPDHLDCLTFLVQASAPQDLKLQISLKETEVVATGQPHDYSETFPKVELRELYEIGPDWCRAVIRVADLTACGGTAAGASRPVHRDILGEINFLLTRKDCATGAAGAGATESVKATERVDEVAFASCAVAYALPNQCPSAEGFTHCDDDSSCPNAPTAN
jgi:hypothetical protein